MRLQAMAGDLSGGPMLGKKNRGGRINCKVSPGVQLYHQQATHEHRCLQDN